MIIKANTAHILLSIICHIIAHRAITARQVITILQDITVLRNIIIRQTDTTVHQKVIIMLIIITLPQEKHRSGAEERP